MVRHVVTTLLLFSGFVSVTFAQVLAVNSPTASQNSQSLDPIPVIVREAGLDGDGNDAITCIKRRTDGKYVVGGWTSSATIEGLLPGMSSPRTGAGEDAFVALLNADLTAVEYVHFFSGAKDERVRDIAFLPNGKVCAVGQTNSADFPVKGSTMLQQRGAGIDGFVAILNADLKTQTVGMLLPGNADDMATGVAVNKQGNIVVVGTTSSINPFPAVKIVNDTARGGTDGFIYMINYGLTYAEFFSFLGGSANDSFTDVALDNSNNLVISGITASQDYYTFPKKIRIPIDDGGGKGEEGILDEGSYKEVGKDPYSHVFNGGSTDAIVAKYTSGGELVYSTYFGGNGDDVANGLVITPDDGACIAGTTSSPNLSTESSSTSLAGQSDGYIATITSDGLRLSGAAYLGGTGADGITAILSAGGDVVTVIGTSASTDMPTSGVGSVPVTAPGSFIARLSTSQIACTSGMHTTGNETITCAAFDEFQDVVVGGTVVPTQMPQAGDPTVDAFIGKYAFGSLAYRSITPSGMVCAGKPLTIQWNVQGFNGEPKMMVDVSTDGGNSWTVLGENITARQLVVTLPNSIPMGSSCLFRIQTNRGHMVTATSALTVGIGPTIIEQPQSLVACPNKPVDLVIVLNDSAATIQWRKDGANLTGQTTAKLTISDVQESDAGSYDAVVGNACGNITTAAATLTVSTTPVIDKQPTDQTVDEGKTATFAVVARGTDLQFQWLRNDVVIAGATQMSYSVSNVSGDDIGYYSCTVTSACGNITTNKVKLSLTQTTGVSVWPDGTTMTVRPQPASSFVSLSIPPSGNLQTLVILSIQGAEQLRTSIPANGDVQNITLDVSTLPAGSYLLQYLSGKDVSTTPFVIVR